MRAEKFIKNFIKRTEYRIGGKYYLGGCCIVPNVTKEIEMNQYLKKRCALLLALMTIAVSTANPVMAAGMNVTELENETDTVYVDIQDQETEAKSETEENEIEIALTKVQSGENETPLENRVDAGYDAFRYAIHDNSVTITGYNGNEAYVNIPEKIEDKFVRTIGEKAFQNNKTVKSVTFPKEAATIEQGAFENCTALEKIIFEDHVFITIKKSAFKNCSGLMNIQFPQYPVVLKENAFENCIACKKLILPGGSIGKNAFKGCTSIESIEINDQLHMDEGVFENCTKLKDVKFYDKQEAIGKEAFKGCSSLKEINIPDSVEAVYEEAFRGCTGLKEINISESQNSDSTIYIHDRAFAYCSNLKSVKLPETKYIYCYDEIFSNCSSLETIYLPERIRLGRYMFANCPKLKNITVSSKNKDLYSKDGLLYRKNSYSGKTEQILIMCAESKKGKIELAKGTTGIDGTVFSGRDNITEIVLPASFEDGFRFEGRLLDGCVALKKISVDSKNKTLKSIDGMLYTKDGTELLRCPPGISGKIKVAEGTVDLNNAFRKCAKLTEISLPSTASKIISFTGTNVLDPLGGTFSECESLVSINVSKKNPYYQSQNGCVYSKDGRELCIVPGGMKGTFTVPKGVVEVKGLSGYRQFRAFDSCSKITKIVIPSTVTSIGSCSFLGCSKLENIVVDSKNPVFYSKDGVLYDRNKTWLLFCPSYKKDVSIPSTVTAIAYNAFNSCTRLKKVKLPSAVKKFQSSAVVDCSFNLYFNSEKTPDFGTVKYTTFSGEKTKITWTEGSGYKLPTGYYYESLSAWKKAIDSNPEFAGIKWKKASGTPTITLAQPKLKKAASSERGKIKITWEKVSGADGYVIYKKSGESWKKLASVSGASTVSYTDKGLTSGKKYTYSVAAYKKSGKTTYTSSYNKTGVSAKVK